MAERYNAPLQVVGFIATRLSDPDRGPEVRIRADDAAMRLVQDGELVWVYGPRRHELAAVVIDNDLPPGGVVLRDIAGASPSEAVRVVKVNTDEPRGRRHFA
jgi:anaerobic selenocysteine-containing dehydrogenase